MRFDIFSSFQIVLLIIVYFLLFYKQQSQVSKENSLIKVFYLIYSFSTLGSLCFSFHLTPAIQQSVLNLQFLISFFLLSPFINNKKAIEALYNGLLVGFILSVIIASFQYFDIPFLNFFNEEELNPNTTYVSADLLIDAKRVWGSFGNALSFSIYLSVVGTILFYYYLYTLKRKLFAYTIFIFTIVIISFTISRMALFAFLISSLVPQVLIARPVKRVTFIATLLTIFTIFYFIAKEVSVNSPLVSRFLNSEDDLKDGRIGLWKVGFKAFEKNVFWGTGPGNLINEIAKFPGWYSAADTKNILGSQHVENYYLTLLYTYGLIPFLFYLAFTFLCFKLSYQYFINGSKNRSNLEYMPLFGAFICFFLNNIINPILISDNRIQILFIFILAITCGHPAMADKISSEKYEKKWA